MSSCHNSIAAYPALPAISIFLRMGTGRIVLELRQYRKSGMARLPDVNQIVSPAYPARESNANVPNRHARPRSGPVFPARTELAGSARIANWHVSRLSANL